MADGTISFAEGLGNKAMDSNEMRRKQRGLGAPAIAEPNTMAICQSAGKPLAALETLQKNPNLPDPQVNFGFHSPKLNQTSPARKLQQVFQKEGLLLDSETRLLQIVGHLEEEINNSEDPFVLDVVTTKLLGIQQAWKQSGSRASQQHANQSNPTPSELETSKMNITGEVNQESSRRGTVPPPSLVELGESSPRSLNNQSALNKLQQVFDQDLIRESEEQANHMQGTGYQFGDHQNQVQASNSNPKVLYNARGNPYMEGDPILGYSKQDSKPRTRIYNAAGSSSLQPATDPTLTSPSHKQAIGLSHSHNQGNPISNQHHQPTPRNQAHSTQPHQFNPKQNTGQAKPKPRNWASLLQSQSPSLDMKLEYFLFAECSSQISVLKPVMLLFMLVLLQVLSMLF